MAENEIIPANTPDQQRIAAEAHSDARAAVQSGQNLINRVTGFFTGNGGSSTDNDDDDETSTGTGTGGQRRSGFRWGDMVGGLLGVGGAWFGSSLFGGGWLGTVMFALLAIPAFMMGRNQVGPWMSRMFGESPRTPAQSHTPTVQPQQTVQQGTDQPGQTQETAPLTPGQRVQQQAAELAEKTEVVGFVLQQQANAGRIEPRRGQQMAQNLNEARETVAGLGQIDFARLTEEQAQLLSRTLRNTDSSLDRMIGNDPIVSVQVMQQIDGLRAQRQQQAAAIAAAQQQVQAQPQPQGVAFAGTPNTAIGVNLTPQAQMAVADVRGNGQGYYYQPAQQGVYEPQRFDRLPEQPVLAAGYYGNR